MRKDEADRILMALDGVMAYLETIRSLVKSSVSEPQPAEPVAIATDDPATCQHPDAVEVHTLGELNMVCHACGQVWAC